ncbi:MAG: tetratricopeptide repeat protein [Chthoniobacterales bacterium]
MDRVSVGGRQGAKWALVGALVPALSLAQQNPGVSARPSGQTLEGPAAEEQLIDLSRPERQQTSLTPTTAESEFFEAAMRGEAWAQTKLGKIYMAAADDPERQQRGVELLRQAAGQNDAEAFYVLASLSAAGFGVEPSNVEAFEQMKRAAELGFTDAQFALGTMYFEGQGTTRNETAAVEAFRRAADGGHREAMFAAGRILLSKTDPEMRAEGLAMMNRAIDNGHIEATLMLATAYGRGSMGMPKDEKKAEALLKPAAERGNADCQMALASLYQFGDAFAARRDEAQVWLQRAADQGQPKAREILSSESEER